MLKNLTKKKIVTILTIALLIINIFIACFIFLDIQIISAPETKVFIDIVEVNSEEIILDAKLKMYNSNSFTISIKDFTVTSLNYDNEELGKLKIKGGSIPSDSSKVFSETETITLKDASNLAIIKNKITGKIGVTLLGFITKTIPIDVMVVTSVEKIFDSIDIPDFDIKAYLTDLSEEGLEFSAEVGVYNPTDLVYNVNELYLDFKTDEGVSVGNVKVTGGVVEPKKTCVFYSDGIVSYEAFNAQVLTLELTGVAGARVGGISKNISISTDASLVIPDIKEFVFGSEEIDFRIPVQFKLRLRGIISNVGFSVYNPSNISLLGDNLVCKLYRVDGEKMTLLGESTMEECPIQAGERKCVKTQVIIPYFKFLFSGSLRLLPDWIVLRIEGDFHVAVTRQAFPLALNAYVDPTVIREKDFH